MDTLYSILYFFIAIGVLVLVHEFGHFIAAKLFGMRVDVFSIGFPPRAFGKKIGDTDYCLSWIPIGGYVKIAGMVDESFDTEFVDKEPQPWEYRSKPKWQRAIVLSAGVIMNVILAILIFWAVMFYEGKTVRTVTEIGSIIPNSSAEKVGLKVGDKLVSINDKQIKHWDEFELLLYAESLSDKITINVNRNNNIISIPLTKHDVPDISQERFGIFPINEFVLVRNVIKDYPAEKIGILAGDTILSINGIKVTVGSLPAMLGLKKGKEAAIEWAHGNTRLSALITPTQDGKIGIEMYPAYAGEIKKESYGVFESLIVGTNHLIFTTKLTYTNLYKIIIGEASFKKSIGGPVRIAEMAKQSADSGVVPYIAFIALLSISLAFINILPFPALDGGHLLFLSYEAIFKRDVPIKIKIALTQAGFAILIAFMLFVTFNDIMR